MTLNGSSGITFPDSTTQASAASTTFGGIGSYVIAASNALATSTTYLAGTTTVAGSSLVYDGTGGATYGAPFATQGYNSLTTNAPGTSYGLSGTWRLMCRISTGSSASYYTPAIWLRIS